jgi:hypothetical protein
MLYIVPLAEMFDGFDMCTILIPILTPVPARCLWFYFLSVTQHRHAVQEDIHTPGFTFRLQIDENLEVCFSITRILCQCRNFLLFFTARAVDF